MVLSKVEMVRPSSDHARTVGAGTLGQYLVRRRRQAISFWILVLLKKWPESLRTAFKGFPGRDVESDESGAI